MRKIIVFLLATLFVLTPIKTYIVANATNGDDESISPKAVVLPGTEDGALAKTHFQMTASGVTSDLHTGVSKSITTSSFNSGTFAVCISGVLTHPNTTASYPKVYVGFAYRNTSGNYIPTFCSRYFDSRSVVYNRTDASLFHRNTTYFGYLRNEMPEYGSVSGTLTYYSLYID